MLHKVEESSQWVKEPIKIPIDALIKGEEIYGVICSQEFIISQESNSVSQTSGVFPCKKNKTQKEDSKDLILFVKDLFLLFFLSDC